MGSVASPIRIRIARFCILFTTAFATWCAALFLAHTHVTYAYQVFVLGGALADVLSCLGVLAVECLERTRAARRLWVVTTPQEFPALPLPDYMLPLVPPLYEPEIATGAARAGYALHVATVP